MDMMPVTDPLTRIRPPVRIDDRVTVRHRLDDGSATDVVGWLVDLDPDRVRIQPPDPEGASTPVSVRRERIILARRVPPALGGRPPARFTAEEVERIALPGWVDSTQRLGNWTLRLGNGFTGRANSCLAVGDPGSGEEELSYERAAAAIVDTYAAAGLEPRVQVIAGSETEWRLRALGWRQTYVQTTVMTQTLNGLLDGHPRDAQVRIDTELTDTWWQGYLQYRPIPDHETARRILINNPPVGLASISPDSISPDSISPESIGGLVALGRGQLNQDWLGIAGLWTDPDHRRRGLATMIIRQLAHWAARRGARNAYLQVASENSGALAAYRALGFVEHHDYRYLAPTPE